MIPAVKPPWGTSLGTLVEVGPADPPEGQRLLAHAIETKFTTNADGTLAPLTEGSTLTVTTIVRHAGIVPVKRFCFVLP
jgi:hypothetical protein